MIIPLFEPAISLELTLSQPLFRRLQRVLDADPTLSLDDLAHKALTAYLSHLDSHPSDRPSSCDWKEL